jgi:cytochrome c1
MRAVFLIFLNVLVACNSNSNEAKTEKEVEMSGIVDGIHMETGLIAKDGFRLVIANCTPCHSAKLVTQNRATREGWEGTIRWMQKKQNLWDLGEAEGEILDYLATNYAPEQKGRRNNLKNIDWYNLED